MAVVIGTNAGFVNSAPTADPAGSATTMDRSGRATQHTSPTGAVLVTEIGWYCDNATEAADYEVGIYTDDTGNNRPLDLVGKSTGNAKGTDAGWKVVSGLSIPISGDTIYWVAVQLDNTITTTNMNYGNNSGVSHTFDNFPTTLLDPWNYEISYSNASAAFYALTQIAVEYDETYSEAFSFSDNYTRTFDAVRSPAESFSFICIINECVVIY